MQEDFSYWTIGNRSGTVRLMLTEQLASEMARLRDELREAKESGRLDYKAVSGLIGKNEAYIQQFVERKSPKLLHAHLVDIVRKALLDAKSAPRKTGGESSRKVSGEAAYSLLERIDIVPVGEGRRAYDLLKTVWQMAGEIPPQTRSDDLSPLANPRREVEPSAPRPRR